MLKKAKISILKMIIMNNKRKQYKIKTKVEKANRLIASSSFLGKTIENSNCKVAKGFSITVAEEKSTYIPNNSAENSLVSNKIEA